ncbi:MAG: hypothetical protein A4E45_00362 [Methanosaeta sp. PtaB.Bin039]|nr:MAG: hypothetical protein A4E45_00362 [Methanosaeta sp. PtaB.Bin039]HOT06259.1 DUF4065 domain-containing protein [Methanotrichaceae archaeon]HQF15700.1 DUF4065 domain-containing protein [Methanotrichaceae archaeon]HQI90627.1 DUF4065 domain-containing protein [Methanotrichaceae archaeon]
MSMGEDSEESMFKTSGLMGYLVKRLNEERPDTQVGKTIIQKMMYLLSRNGIIDFDFSMYHYGPYSSEVAGELNFAERNGIVEISWEDDKGYFIKPTNKIEKFSYLLDDDEKRAVDELIERFGGFKAIDLSLIATALYLKDNFGVGDDRLVDAVHNAKNKYSLVYIEGVLKAGGIISAVP